MGEGGQIPEIAPNFDKKTLLPTTMESIKVISRFTSELARQSVVAVDAALTANLVASVAATLDHAFISGNGDGVTTIKGLLNWAGTQSLAIDGALTVDDLYDAWTLTQTAYIDQGDLVWWMRPETLVSLRKLKATGSGEYLIENDP
ncbi:MAG: hypothetical protein QOK10_2822, partial [Pseudonocardiales bacterium]|nr:hypothetical protein [Pseudonocardiales bacterium]